MLALEEHFEIIEDEDSDEPGPDGDGEPASFIDRMNRDHAFVWLNGKAAILTSR